MGVSMTAVHIVHKPVLSRSRHTRPMKMTRTTLIFLLWWSVPVRALLAVGRVVAQGDGAGHSRKITNSRGPSPWYLPLIRQQGQVGPRRRECFETFSEPVGLRASINGSSNPENDSSSMKQRFQKWKAFADKNFFLVGMFAAVALARLAPALGKNGGVLRPELFIGKFGVTFIFLLSGLSLELSELRNAATNIKLNSLIQMGTFLAWPFLLGVPLTSLLRGSFPGLLPTALLDGLLILTCLPTTVNMCVILSSTAGGNTASALCNAIVSNLLGIFATPALLFRFFGASIQLPFLDMLVKLCNKVLVPVAVGQGLRKTPIKTFYESYSKRFKRLQEVVLLSILWNAFCTAICNGLGLSLRHGIVLALILPTLHAVSLAGFFKFFSWDFLKFARPDAVSAMFCASQKTLAFGLPLIQTIFEGNPNLALYCAPLMFFHPLELIMGSALVPALEAYVHEKPPLVDATG